MREKREGQIKRKEGEKAKEKRKVGGYVITPREGKVLWEWHLRNDDFLDR